MKVGHTILWRRDIRQFCSHPTDLLARLSLYLLPESSPAFAPLVKPLLTPRAIPESLVVILLDWIEPWRWVRQLRDWIRFLRSVTSELSEEAQESAESVMTDWQQRRRGRPPNDFSGTASSTDSNVVIPLSQGEWDEPLGLPLCVVCHRADKIDTLETQQSWGEEDFDFVLQFLRTILMKHGSSLIYTSVSVPNSLPILIHSSLGIQSLLKKQTFKHNVIDRDKILIPPNWDSWGKILVLREGFDVEAVSSGWSNDIHQPQTSENVGDSETANRAASDDAKSPVGKDKVLPLYEETIRDPRKDRESSNPNSSKLDLVQAPSMQAFLTTQMEIMERLKKEEEEAAAAAQEKEKASRATTAGDGNLTQTSRYFDNLQQSDAISDQIGPVQFNMGGIQVDADDMLKRLKNREGSAAADKSRSETQTPSSQTPTKAGGDQKAQNEQLANFFSSLMKKDRSSSPYYARKSDDDR
ncbi:hypothetical protein G7Y79_00002g007420 [Physcia stellaris]|nr:hypothetical protein G7Y79_00002g007420 [Physcia stellaris]